MTAVDGHLIGGTVRRAAPGALLAVHAPDGALLGHIARATRADTDDALATARGAQAGWASLAPRDRGEAVAAFAEALEARADRVAARLVEAGA
ncbi:MAG: aldehyde dehydrogenase family protein, partial [Actinomycetota bacterium]